MKRNTTTFAALAIASSLMLVAIGSGMMPTDESSETSNDAEPAIEVRNLPSVEEARGRAKLLHETIRATLKVVHHEYYREDQKLPIPARTLKSVFRDLASNQQVNLRWLAVNAQAMSVEHNPQDEFERNAVNELASGKATYDLAKNGVYRYAGTITLTSECLKCHLPNRTSTKDRAAGLLVTMPIAKP
ncbi:MAG: signal peptide protein [Planctomycetota bacterium]|nr:MAG: signal peptide protein [Planctomycetota bacterium]